MLPFVILLILFIYEFVKFINQCIYIETEFFIPAVIKTQIEEDIICHDTLYVKDLKVKRYTEEPYYVFEQDHIFENKIDGKQYAFPYEKIKCGDLRFSKIGRDAKVMCKYVIKRNRKTGEIIEWIFMDDQLIKKGDTRPLYVHREDDRLVEQRVLRKRNFKGVHHKNRYDAWTFQEDVNKYNDILSKEDGLDFYKPLEDFLLPSETVQEFFRKSENAI